MAHSDAAPDLDLLAARRMATFKYLRPVSAALGAFYAAMTLIDLITLSGRVAVTSATVAITLSHDRRVREGDKQESG